MASKKRRRRARLPKAAVEPETHEQQRKKFPEALVETYLAISKNGWESTRLYNRFVKERTKYLGKRADDPIEQSKVVVNLARATMDLRETKKKTKVVKKRRRKKKC